MIIPKRQSFLFASRSQHKNLISLINNMFALYRCVLLFTQKCHSFSSTSLVSLSIFAFFCHQTQMKWNQMSMSSPAAKRRRDKCNHKRLEVRCDGCWPFVPYHIHIVYNNFNTCCPLQCTQLHSITADVYIPF